MAYGFRLVLVRSCWCRAPSLGTQHPPSGGGFFPSASSSHLKRTRPQESFAFTASAFGAAPLPVGGAPRVLSISSCCCFILRPDTASICCPSHCTGREQGCPSRSNGGGRVQTRVQAGPKGPHVSLFQALDTATTQVLGRSQRWPLTKDPSFPMGGPGPLTQPYFHHRLEFRWQLCEWSLELKFTSHRQHSE